MAAVTAVTANIGQISRRCAVKYIKHEDAQLVRYASGNQRSSGVAWLRDDHRKFLSGTEPDNI